jgi:hypothetical protein
MTWEPLWVLLSEFLGLGPPRLSILGRSERGNLDLLRIAFIGLANNYRSPGPRGCLCFDRGACSSTAVSVGHAGPIASGCGNCCSESAT